MRRAIVIPTMAASDRHCFYHFKRWRIAEAKALLDYAICLHSLGRFIAKYKIYCNKVSWMLEAAWFALFTLTLGLEV